MIRAIAFDRSAIAALADASGRPPDVIEDRYLALLPAVPTGIDETA